MSIFATILSIDDHYHEPDVCTKYVEVTSDAGWGAATSDGRYWQRVEGSCTCGNRAPLVYQGSHVNPVEDGPRGGALLVCGIPDHCHPDARWGDDDHGKPVPFLRLSAYEDETTFQGGDPGQATLVLDLAQVVQLRDTLTEWIDTRAEQKREDASHGQ